VDAVDTDSDIGQYDIPAGGNELWPLSGNLSPNEQSPRCVANTSLAYDRRRLGHVIRLRQSSATHFQTGISLYLM